MANVFDVGLNYIGDFGPVGIEASGRWGIAQNNLAGGQNPQIWGAGLRVGVAGVTVGGSFAEQNNTAFSDGRAFDVGISYETGPWAMSFTYLNGENADDEQADATLAVPAGSDENAQQFLAGVSYALAQGITVGGYGAYVDFEEDVGDAGGAGDDVDGIIVGGAIQIEF